MIRILSRSQASESILARRGLDSTELPASVPERNRAIFGAPLGAEEAVARILSDVRRDGDAAVADYCRRIDGVELDGFYVQRDEVTSARQRIAPGLLGVLELAAKRIRAFHQKQKRQSWIDWSEGGLGQMVRPIDRVACYVPGGTAPYPSTVLMTVVPAKVAGVPEVTVATPCGKDGSIPDITLAACAVAGADRVLRIGGAQAIAALAYGTESIERVDKIVGPGNLFVALAKRQVFGAVGIDALHGPTETMLIADESANPAYCAADMLAQAEHDPQASPILVTTSRALAEQVAGEIERQLPPLERRDIARAAVEEQGGIVVTDTLEEAVEVTNRYAPEHLCLLVRDPFRLVPGIRNAGGIFLGESSFEVMGDYIAGPSHTMPTGGTARFSSALNVDDFTKITSIVALDAGLVQSLGPAAAALARAEGLTAHAAAVDIRLQGEMAGVRERRAGQP